MPLPPWESVSDILWYLLAPGLGASLAVMLAVRLLGRERFTPLAAALALAAGVWAGNHFREPFIIYEFDKGSPVNCRHLRMVLGWSLETRPDTNEAEESDVPPRVLARWWLPWLALLAMVTELLARPAFVPPSAAWIARTIVALFAGRLVTPDYLRIESPWVPWFMAGVILLEWAIMVSLTRQWKDGTVAAAVAMCCGAGGVVILHAGFAMGMEAGLFFYAALLGLALVACFKHGDTGPALAAAAVYLPGLLLTSNQDMSGNTEVPDRCFLLVGLAPLALAPFLLPPLVRQKGWKHWLPGLLLPLIPAMVAVYLAAEAAPLSF